MSEAEDENMHSSDTDDQPPKSSISKLKTRGRKRKRLDSSSSEDENVLPENALEMEKNLHASAIKNNLNDVSVKKILKKVVTNDHVLALVKLREEEEESSTDENIRPKLTRAKVKELMKVSPKSARWNLENLELTPIKHIPIKTRPEVKALMAQEMQEDEDDDEYQPAQDDVPSDDDHTMESNSDVDSLPRTPATPKTASAATPKVITDGPFKVPQDLNTPTRRKLNLDEEATIALRTRSKLSLSATPIEHIESSFVPPDDIPMVDVDDPVWNEFLEECLNPASTSHVRNEDDDDADPEYNVAADPDAHDDDEEALENSIIKISKKELNDLVNELFNIMPEESTEDKLTQDVVSNNKSTKDSLENTVNLWDGKQETKSDDEINVDETVVANGSGVTYFSIGKSEPEETDIATIHTDTDNQKTIDVTQVNGNTIESVATNNNMVVTFASQTVNGPQILPPGILIPVKIIGNQVTFTPFETTPNLVCVEEQTGSTRPETPPAQPPQVLQAIPVEKPVVMVQLDSKPAMLSEQILILQQQIRQHIQLIASNFLQLYVHPTYWSYAPTYKEYMETLINMVIKNPNSVVNVCNLKQALELITTWEKAVSEPTPENNAMVKFIQKQIEKSRSRCAQNSLYVGEFHETMMDVVVNSPVFLYPYLLPSMPYRPSLLKRFKFLRSEDELIALGLDEFWTYVEENKELYPLRNTVYGRSGLKMSIKLLCRHMLSWLTPHALLSHVRYVRRHDKENPIYKYFESRKVEPVKHELLPYNPNITLYEHPEYEIPRNWLRHLAKTSKRFKNYLHRRTNVTGMVPRGIDIALGSQVTQNVKKPLPIDFTKVIPKNLVYLQPKAKSEQPIDKYDVHIENGVPMSNQDTVPNSANDETTTVSTVSQPICSTSETNTQHNSDYSANMKKNTSEQSNETNIEHSNVLDSRAVDKSNDNVASLNKQIYPERNSKHCTCCTLLRRISKERQTLITEYYKPSRFNMKNTCPCMSIERPKITNKLRLLLRYYKNHSMYVHKDMKLKISQCDENNADLDYGNISNGSLHELLETSDPSDLEFVTTFTMKVLIRLALARNRFIKKYMYVLLSKFDPETDEPATLAIELEKVFDVELVDLFKEFLRCLTPEQADGINKFKEYFTQTCASNLVKKISEEVTDKRTRQALLTRLVLSFTDNKSSACGTCSDLLQHMAGYKDLAAYTFSLFPHKRLTQITTSNINKQTNTQLSSEGKSVQSIRQNSESEQEEETLTICEQAQTMMDCNDDHSSTENVINEEENENEFIATVEKNIQEITEKMIESQANNQKYDLKVEDQEVEELEHNNDTTLNLNNVKDELMSDDDSVKSEGPEWQRIEDKQILEIIKQSLTREEHKHKTILGIVDEKEVLEMLTNSLPHKSVKDITHRATYLMERICTEI